MLLRAFASRVSVSVCVWALYNGDDDDDDDDGDGDDDDHDDVLVSPWLFSFADVLPLGV